MINWPTELVNDIARRRCVLFLGAGVSANSVNSVNRRPKTWKGFLEDALEGVSPNVHIKRLIKENDYLTACELIKRAIGAERFTTLVKEEFLHPQYSTATIHETIFQLDSRVVVTPNFDKIYETYANAKANGSIVVKQYYEEDVTYAIRESGRLILKVHGTIDTPSKMIFTRAEYAGSRTKYGSFYEILEALSYTHTFVFIGCGMNDPDIRLLLEDTFFKHKISRPHVVLMPKSALHASVVGVLQDTMNLRVLTYSKNDHHKELQLSLTELVEKVEVVRDQISNDRNW